MTEPTELLKEHVKRYNTAIGKMVDYHSCIIKKK